MAPVHISVVGAFALPLLASVAVVVAVVVLGLDVSGAVQVAAAIAALAGAALAWLLRDRLRPSEGGSSNRWWYVAAVVVGGVLVSTPDAIQVLAMSALAGFLVACSVVVADVI